MAYSEVFPMANRATGLQTTFTQPWPQGARAVSIRFDVWGAGGAADPWTGVAQPFNDPARKIEAGFGVRYADNRIEEPASATWVGHADGNFGSQKPGSPKTQPTLDVTFVTSAELPVEARLRIRVIQGPITAGMSVQIQ